MSDNDDLNFEDLSNAEPPAEPEPAAGGEVEGAEDDGEEVRTATDLAAVYDIPVSVSAVLGRASMQVSSLMKLGAAPSSNSTARSARRSTSTSTTAWSRAARSSWSRNASA